MLAEAGFAVAEASNGMAALRHATVAAPQIVLIGQRLPEIPPADVVHSLRTDPRTQHAAVVQLGLGPDLFDSDARIGVPCSLVELRATIVSALEGRQAKLQPRVLPVVAPAPMRSVSASVWGA